jgi:hypothetical protein
VALNLLVKLVAQNDDVLAISGQKLRFGIARIPDPGLSHEVETGTVENCGVFTLCIRSEEYRRAEDSLERSDEAPVLRSTLLHPEGIQHLRSAIESDPRTLLPYRQGREKDRDEPILPPRQSVARMPGNLQNELSVSALVKKASRCRSFHGQTAKDERPRREPEVLLFGFALFSNRADGASLAQFPL